MALIDDIFQLSGRDRSNFLRQRVAMPRAQELAGPGELPNPALVDRFLQQASSELANIAADRAFGPPASSFFSDLTGGANPRSTVDRLVDEIFRPTQDLEIFSPAPGKFAQRPRTKQAAARPRDPFSRKEAFSGERFDTGKRDPFSEADATGVSSIVGPRDPSPQEVMERIRNLVKGGATLESIQQAVEKGQRQKLPPELIELVGKPDFNKKLVELVKANKVKTQDAFRFLQLDTQMKERESVREAREGRISPQARRIFEAEELFGIKMGDDDITRIMTGKAPSLTLPQMGRLLDRIPRILELLATSTSPGAQQAMIALEQARLNLANIIANQVSRQFAGQRGATTPGAPGAEGAGAEVGDLTQAAREGPQTVTQTRGGGFKPTVVGGNRITQVR